MWERKSRADPATSRPHLATDKHGRMNRAAKLQTDGVTAIWLVTVN